MNNDRRKSIDTVIKTVEELKLQYEALREAFDAFIEAAGEARNTIEELKGEEDEYRENMHENLQSSERYQNSEAASAQLQTAYDSLDSFANEELTEMDLDEVITALDEAKA